MTPLEKALQRNMQCNDTTEIGVFCIAIKAVKSYIPYLSKVKKEDWCVIYKIVGTESRCNMIIRSQDKKYVINFEQVDTVCLGGVDGKRVITFTDSQVVTLGTYSTEEKAIKVLDMICEAYVKSQALYIDRENNSKVITQNIAIQMPSDEEVEV